MTSCVNGEAEKPALSHVEAILRIQSGLLQGRSCDTLILHIALVSCDSVEAHFSLADSCRAEYSINMNA